MAFREFTSTAAQLYDKWIKDADPRTKDWPLMSSPLPQTVIIVFYIYFVMSLGPRLMENRKPFDLKRDHVTLKTGARACVFISK
uniref:Uncharacterized protein n=1 Tax=Sinocyclocheilus grahami TaxID=75366 RepID=A0A672QK28_SINGR